MTTVPSGVPVPTPEQLPLLRLPRGLPGCPPSPRSLAPLRSANLLSPLSAELTVEAAYVLSTRTDGLVRSSDLPAVPVHPAMRASPLRLELTHANMSILESIPQCIVLQPLERMLRVKKSPKKLALAKETLLAMEGQSVLGGADWPLPQPPKDRQSTTALPCICPN